MKDAFKKILKNLKDLERYNFISAFNIYFVVKLKLNRSMSNNFYLSHYFVILYSYSSYLVLIYRRVVEYLGFNNNKKCQSF